MASAVETRCWLGGSYVQGSGPAFTINNPSTEDKVVEVKCATLEDVNQAVKLAKAAQPAWAARPAEERAALLCKWADLIEANAKELNQLDGMTMGQVAGEAGLHAYIAASKLRYAAGLANTVAGETTLHSPGKFCMTIRQPYGVTAAIIPWNVPLAMLIMKVAPALAAGNAIIVKSSEKSPLACAFAAGLTEKAGFPPGILSVLTGAGETGKFLCEHMEIRKISFTGSTRTGRLVAQMAAKSNLKEVSLELGGKSPSIIFQDANLDKAVPTLAFSLLWNSGQICMATTRVYVHESIAEDFKARYVKAIEGFKQGNSSDASVQIGPLADAGQQKAVQGFLDEAMLTAKPISGGQKHTGKGYFVVPTIFDNVGTSSRVSREEIFGPVVVLHTFKDEDEAVEMANDTEYGLYASLWTSDISRALRVAKLLEAGHVAINDASPSSANQLPLIGWKASGSGAGDCGLDDVKHWTEIKSMIVNIE